MTEDEIARQFKALRALTKDDFEGDDALLPSEETIAWAERSVRASSLMTTGIHLWGFDDGTVHLEHRAGDASFDVEFRRDGSIHIFTCAGKSSSLVVIPPLKEVPA